MKKSIKWVIFSFVVLYILPLLAAKFAGPSGMALCYIMFFAINPIFFIAEGIAAGKCIKKYWFMPLDSALIYILSMWIVFDMGESAFLLYAGTYFAIGTIVMLITSAICYVAAKKQIPKEKVINYSIFAVVLIVIITIIITIQYDVDGQIYTKKKFLNYNITCPNVGSNIDVYYDKEKPSRITLSL